jgi:imidazolonepropionase-like amidohydrolase
MRAQLILIVIGAVVMVMPEISARQVATGTIALVGGRVYAEPEAVPIDNAVVVVQGARIVAVGPGAGVTSPPGATTIDCAGLVITAGFYNAHVHFTDPIRWENAETRPATELTMSLREMLTKYGYTTVVDTASDLSNTLQLRRRIMSGEIAGPRILTAGYALYPPNGVPFYVREEVPAAVVAQLPQPATAAAARAIVARQFDAGSDIVKLFAGSYVERGKVLPIPLDVARAAADEAHARGKLVFAHPSNTAGLEAALDANVDVLAHSLDDTRGMTEQHYARMKKQNVAMIPTLTLFRGRSVWDMQDEVRKYARMGGQMIFGTDVGYLPNFDHTQEYELLAGAGLGWREILAALTLNPASRFKDAERGKVAAGMAADLVVLGADPAMGVRNFGDVRYAIRAGSVIYQAR